MSDPISGSLIYSLGKDFFKFLCGIFRRKPARLTPVEVVEKRQKWKSEIEDKLAERKRDGLSNDIIVRDVSRIDEYPDVKDKQRGISSWFKAGLMGTYHRGVQLGLQWDTLMQDGDGWRRTDYKAGESGDIKVMLIGFVPYERIEAISWTGDDYYSESQLYCHFESRKGEPYEKIVYCEQRAINEHHTYFAEIVDSNEVKRIRRRRWFGKK